MSTNRVRFFRLMAELNQHELQLLSGVSASTICMIERNIRKATKEQRKLLSKTLGQPEKILFPEGKSV